MAGQNGFPKRRRAGSRRVTRGAETVASRREKDTSPPAVRREALDVARYVTDLAAQLEAMAIASNLDLLAYFLGMARAEGDLYVRTHVEGLGPADETSAAEPTDSQARNDNAFD